jgi:hypothetical protein
LSYNRRRRVNETTSAYLQIADCSNSTLNNYWGFVDPDINSDNGVVFQFIDDKSKATNFTIQNHGYGDNLAGYRDTYVAGSTNEEGTATGGAVYMSPLDLYIQGGEPLITTAFNSTTGVVELTDKLGDGTKRYVSQACFISDVGYYDAGLPVLVVGERYFGSDNCANITLYWRPITT